VHDLIKDEENVVCFLDYFIFIYDTDDVGYYTGEKMESVDIL
jgi:hypothetical protein